MELAVPRRQGLPAQRRRQDQPPLGNQAVAAPAREWLKWNYPFNPSSPYSWGHKEQDEVWAMYITDNWRAFRTWGISARNAWGYSVFWELRDGVKRQRQNLKVDWDNLQKPGLSPDYFDTPPTIAAFDTALERNDWIPTKAGGSPHPQQHAAVGLHRRQAGRTSPPRSTTTCPGKRSRSRSSSSTTRGPPSIATAPGRWACRSPCAAARSSPSRRASRSASR